MLSSAGGVGGLTIGFFLVKKDINDACFIFLGISSTIDPKVSFVLPLFFVKEYCVSKKGYNN
ncbi:hypothetical protein PP714_10355 [Lacticaseibacillus paracasei]|nr:hypothetical protein [Lacticaseibacillus paracasei]